MESNDINVINSFLKQTYLVSSYRSIPNYFILKKPGFEKSACIKFFEYNNNSMLDLADIVRPVLFLENDGLNHNRIIDILRKLKDQDINERIKKYLEYEKKIARSKIISTNNFRGIKNRDKISISILKDKVILKEYRSISSIRDMLYYSKVYLYSQKWHSDFFKEDNFHQMSKFEKNICFFSTISYLNLMIEPIMNLRLICNQAIKRGLFDE